MMTMTAMATTNRANAWIARVISAQCPACNQTTSLHEESVVIGTEVVCMECAAILRVDNTNPLILTEIEGVDLL